MSLSDIAAERAQEGLNYYEFPFRAADGTRKTVRFPTCYFTAPQYYYSDYPRFDTTEPRQLQCYLAGRIHYPIPMQMPKFTAEQTAYSQYLRTTVQVGQDFLEPQEFAKIVKQATINNAVGGVPASASKTNFKRNPSGLFTKQLTTEPLEGLRRVDSRLNQQVSGRMSLAEGLRQSMSQHFNNEGNQSGILAGNQSGMFGDTTKKGVSFSQKQRTPSGKQEEEAVEEMLAEKEHQLEQELDAALEELDRAAEEALGNSAEVPDSSEITDDVEIEDELEIEDEWPH